MPGTAVERKLRWRQLLIPELDPIAQRWFDGTRPTSGVAMLGTILLVILILVLIGALPRWPYSSGWGYYPSGGIGLLLIILIILLLAGQI
jgi:hypothetical protein